ncbi:peroxiredoxin [Lewinella sp. W8]|uniref:peroxiredoxin n=1 Tax=Lewinella sp. W8 TaxID=2528208 RepID=UPI001C12C138|nr:peroxiredoxin [Lewinella sp. W8]
MQTTIETAITMPRIGDQAPDFTAVTTTGKLTFSDYAKDSWVVMFSHPADFTPVCTTEMSAFAKEADWFAERGTKLMGLSIDSVHSHLAWVNNVREKTGVYMEFPIIADIDMKVSKLYGMLHPGESATAAVRAVFFIDPKGVIRLIMYYPMNVGRNMHEIKRALVALQTSDESKCAMPIDWRPGDKAIVPPPKTLREMDERIANTEYEKIDFYLAKKDI